jgi:hypothetical protein
MSSEPQVQVVTPSEASRAASRHCYKCNSFRAGDGGSFILDAQRMKRWICAQCTARRKKPGAAPGEPTGANTVNAAAALAAAAAAVVPTTTKS